MKSLLRVLWILILGLVDVQAVSVKERFIQFKLPSSRALESTSQRLPQFTSLFEASSIDRVDVKPMTANDKPSDMIETFANLFKTGMPIKLSY